MADPDTTTEEITIPEAAVSRGPGMAGFPTSYNLENERLDCDNIGKTVYSSLFSSLKCHFIPQTR